MKYILQPYSLLKRHHRHQHVEQDDGRDGGKVQNHADHNYLKDIVLRRTYPIGVTWV